MFATTDPEKVLPTILSRCQRFDLRRIPAALISKHLTYIASQEKVQIEPAALYAIARGAEGALRDAESTLDQLISFCGDKIEESDVLSMFGLTAQGQLLELSQSILAGEIQASLRRLNDLATQGKDLGRLLSDLLNHFRNLLVFQVSRGDSSMLEISEAEEAALKEQAKAATTDVLTRIMEVLAEAEMRLRDAASKKILVEVAVLKAIEARNSLSLDTVLKRLQQLRDADGGAAATVPAVPPAVEPAPKPYRAGPAAAPPRTERQETRASAPVELHEPGRPATVAPVENLEELWANLVEAVGKVSPFTRTYLMQAHPVSFARNVFAIGFPPEFEDHITLVDNPRNHTLLQTKLTEFGHANSQIKFVKAEAPPGRVAATPTVTAAPEPVPATNATVRPAANAAPAPAANAPSATAKEKLAPVPFSKDQFKDDPLIQKALEIFKGQIVEVRA
jgi:DNA polymerase-3 subunit gamma/tau